MKCKVCMETVLSYSLDGRENALPLECKTHLEECETCRLEWKHSHAWVQLLRSQEQWTPDEDYIQRLTDLSMQEKRRAKLTESALRDLGGTPGFASWFGWIWSYPKTSFAAAAVMVGLFVFVASGWNYLSMVGNFDYVSGHVIVQSEIDIQAQAGNHIQKGTTVQTTKGAESVLALSDGTEILLSSLTRLTIDDYRSVSMQRGKAFFEVQKGSDDFLIEVPDGQVRVLGTSFSVEVINGETVVTVLKGVVECMSPKKSVQVPTGYEGIFQDQTALLRQSNQIQQTQRWVSAIQKKRDKEELSKYYPSLASPEQAKGRE